MNKKGFTLLEVLGVVVIIVLILVLVLPNLINSVKNKGIDVDNTTKEIIYKAANLYIKDLDTTYKKEVGNTYCIALTELQNKDLLKEPIQTFDGDDISEDYSVKMKYEDGFDYELITNEECEIIKAVNIAKKCKSDGKCGTCTTLASLKSDIPLNNPKYIDYIAEYGKIDSTGIEDFVIDLKVNTYEVKNDDASFNSCMNELVENAAREYVNDNKTNFKDRNRNVYCVSIPTLIDNGYLFLSKNGLSGENDRYKSMMELNVKILGTGEGLDYEISKDCTPYTAPTICKAVKSGDTYDCKYDDNKTLGNLVKYDNFGNIAEYNIGDSYVCDVKGTGDYVYKFFILASEPGKDTVDMISHFEYSYPYWLSKSTHNQINTKLNYSVSYGDKGNPYYGPVSAYNYIYENTKDWIVPNINVNFTDPDKRYLGVYTDDNITKIIHKDGTLTNDKNYSATYENLKARLPYKDEIVKAGAAQLFIRVAVDSWEIGESECPHFTYGQYMLMDSNSSNSYKYIDGGNSSGGFGFSLIHQQDEVKVVISIPKDELS